jgi:hypothetical protein
MVGSLRVYQSLNLVSLCSHRIYIYIATNIENNNKYNNSLYPQHMT